MWVCVVVWASVGVGVGVWGVGVGWWGWVCVCVRGVCGGVCLELAGF